MVLPTRNQVGISLIEMIIVVSIILVILGGAIAGFFRFNDRQSVINTANAVKQVLESARTRARVRDNPNQACGTLQGYRVLTSGSTLQSRLMCGTSKFSLTQGQVRDTYQIPTGITVTSMNVTFYTLAGSALVTQPPSPGYIYISGNSIHYMFQILSSGQITEGCFVASPGSTTCL